MWSWIASISLRCSVRRSALIARRAFERRFSLADHIKVVGAILVNGMLHVDLTREVPESAKPRKIEIGGGEPQLVEQKQAA